jgi:alkaline phosphatase
MRVKALALALTGALLFVASATAQNRDDRRNVILIIGDGMDDQQITIARNYLAGAQGKLVLDDMPVRSTSQVLTVDEQSPATPVYVADSANSATSMATGKITSRGRIGTSARDDKDIATIAEQAKAAGYRTGIISTASVTDATPASFISHVASRGCENPNVMLPSDDFPSWLDPAACKKDMQVEGGLGSIAEQIANGDTDVVMGGGLKHFVSLAEDSQQTVLQLAEINGYQIVKKQQDLNNIDPRKKILGLFTDGTMPTRLQGENGRIAEKPKPSLLNRIDWRLGSVELPQPMACESNPEFDDTPSIKTMTDATLKYLSAQESRGFFLMVESASIDKQSHARNPCGSIGELQQLEEALISALEFAEHNPNTLILVTADHGQAAQIIPENSLFSRYGVPVYTAGHVARIQTPENQIIAVNYATNDFPYEEHTGVNVPLFSNHEGAGRVASMVTQPEIYAIMMAYLGLPY